MPGTEKEICVEIAENATVDEIDNNFALLCCLGVAAHYNNIKRDVVKRERDLDGMAVRAEGASGGEGEAIG